MRKKGNGIRGLSISTKISVLIIIMVLLCSVSIGIFSYVVYRNDCERYKSDAVLDIAITVASNIDGDKLSEIVLSGEKNEYYSQIQSFIENVRKHTGLEYLYVIVDNGDGVNYKYIFDADGEDRFGTLDPIEGYGADETFASGKNITIESSSENYGTLISAFTPIFDSQANLVGVIGADIPIEDVINEINSFGMKIVLVVFLFNVAFYFLSRIYIERSLGRPVKTLSVLGKRLAEGELNLDINIKNKDEIGLLADSFTYIMNTLNNLISSIKQMSDKQSGGDNEAFIDVSNFKGGYHTVAVGVNNMVAEYVKDTNDIISTVSAFGAGDFKKSLRLFPGKKNSTNKTIEKLRDTFKKLDSEISSLVVSASKGDLTKKIDSENYEGSWSVLTQELNDLLRVVIEPIKESQTVLSQMANGNLSAKVEGIYEGDFEIIKKSLNSTQSAISSYITEISDVLSEMSEQNLNVSIKREYIGDFNKIKDSINMIINTFNKVLADINSSTEQVASGSRQISETSFNLSQGASEQAGVVEELNSTIEKIAVQTDKNADTAAKADSIMSETKNYVEKEAALMKKMMAAMEEINKASARISTIIKVIEDIAFQTNLLALNAAVEAARAGEQGKGFAVVADEVRNLAAKSQAAVNDTAAIIDGSVKTASDGVKVANETAEALGVIVTLISEASVYIQTIASASKEQKTNINQITGKIGQVSKVTQDNTAISQECASSSQELSSQADLFRSTVAKFRLKK